MQGIAIITLRTSTERRHERRGRREIWRTFFSAGSADPFANGFGALRALEEVRLPPGAALSPDPIGDGETLTFVNEGALKLEDPTEGVCVMRAGALQRAAPPHDVAPRARNASRTSWAHVLRFGLARTEDGRSHGCARRLFTAADRRGTLLLVASPDGRDGSLRTRGDVRLLAAMLLRGHHVVHELPPGRGAWLHVVQGAVKVGGAILSAGDGAGVTGASAISITALQPSSVLLLELADPPPPPFFGA
jgi:redox-sensitive bicupin YhaK (pirin superfamily)